MKGKLFFAVLAAVLLNVGVYSPCVYGADNDNNVKQVVAKTASPADNDMVDLYIGGGIIERDMQGVTKSGYDKGNHAKDENDDKSFYAKLRVRPFYTQLKNGDTLSGGVVGQYSYYKTEDTWSGLPDRNETKIAKYLVGPTSKYYGKHWDLTGDLMFGWGKKDLDINSYKQVDVKDAAGKVTGKELVGTHDGYQDDFKFWTAALYGSYYSRRDAGKQWLPKAELYANYTKQIGDADTERTAGSGAIPSWYKPNDEECGIIGGKLSIYDFKLGDRLRLTPGVNASYKFTSGNYWQGGPFVTLSSNNSEILSISFLNYRQGLGGTADAYIPIEGFISFGGLYQAIKRNGIKTVAAAPSVQQTQPIMARETEKVPAVVKAPDNINDQIEEKVPCPPNNGQTLKTVQSTPATGTVKPYTVLE